MRTIRRYGYCLVLVQLLGIVGCNHQSPAKAYVGVMVAVKINNCKVLPEWQPLHLKDAVKWEISPAESTPHTYSIYFPKPPMTTPPTTVTPSQPAVSQPVAGNTYCDANQLPSAT